MHLGRQPKREPRASGPLRIGVEDLLNRVPEVAGHPDGERKGRVVAALLDRVDGLPRNAQGRAERLLRKPLGCAQSPDVVAHLTRFLYIRQMESTVYGNEVSTG
jgi:hypothetical protein